MTHNDQRRGIRPAVPRQAWGAGADGARMSRTAAFRAFASAGLAAHLLMAAGCASMAPAPSSPGEEAARAAFDRDRSACRAVAERLSPYVDPRDDDAVSARSFHVEGETQRCMLARGWNTPTFDGWRNGRS